MPLIKPYLAKADDRTQKPTISEKSGDPFDWFNTDYFKELGCGVLTFDFFYAS